MAASSAALWHAAGSSSRAVRPRSTKLAAVSLARAMIVSAVTPRAPPEATITESLVTRGVCAGRLGGVALEGVALAIGVQRDLEGVAAADELTDEGVGHGAVAALVPVDVDGTAADGRPLLRGGLGEAGQTADPRAQVFGAREPEVGARVLHGHEDARGPVRELRCDGLRGFEGFALNADRVIDGAWLGEPAEEDDAVALRVGRSRLRSHPARDEGSGDALREAGAAVDDGDRLRIEEVRKGEARRGRGREAQGPAGGRHVRPLGVGLRLRPPLWAVAGGPRNVPTE